jgi:hypothetical protein
MTLAHLRSRLLLGAVALAAAGLAAAPAQAALTISNGATKNVSCSNSVCQATAKNAVLNASDLETMLASADVTVQSKSKAKDIELRVALSFASANRLTLDAYRSITFDKPLTVAGSGALTLSTDDGGTGGELSFVSPGRVAFWDLSSSLVIDGASYTLAGDLATLASDIAANPAGHYALANNYDASADGTYTTSPIPTSLTGVFNGLGNSVSNFTIVAEDSEFGLFRELPGTVAWLKIENAEVVRATMIVGGDAGILAGASSGTIIGVSTSGNAAASAPVGGLVGVFSGTMIACHSSANVLGNESSGGLAGTNAGTIASGSATGTVTGARAGGLVGDNGATISGSFATGRVKSKASDFIMESAAGGLVGVNEGSIANSYARGAAAVANVGEPSSAGGLIGRNASTGTVNSSYSTGAPSATGHHDHSTLIGGSIGIDESGSGSLADVYWDTDSSGITDLSDGAGNISSDPGITGLTTLQLQSGLPMGFDPGIWAEQSGVNDGLPYLIGNPTK